MFSYFHYKNLSATPLPPPPQKKGIHEFSCNKIDINCIYVNIDKSIRT